MTRRRFGPVPKKSPTPQRRRLPQAQQGFGILSGLGVHGYEPIEDAFLAGLALGEPILLVGGIGAAKTRLAERTALALGMRFWAYDASKAVFEDVVGFPDPRAMQEGRVEYLDAPLTLWGKEFILVDELSRAPIGMQNKWLEVIQSRRLMGMALLDLQVIVAAMNPPGLVGTMPLDPALAGRFTFVLRVPEVHDLSDEDRKKVIASERPGFALHRGAQKPLPAEASSNALVAFIRRTRGEMTWAEKTLRTSLVAYLDRVREYLNYWEVSLDGRRLGMMYRAILALAAVHRACERLPPDLARPPFDLFRHALDCTLPAPALGEDIPSMVLDAAHRHAVAASEGRERPVVVAGRFLDMVRDFLARQEAWMDQRDSALMVTRLVNALEHPTRVEPAVEAAAALAHLMARPEAHTRLDADTRNRLWCCWREATSLEPERANEFANQVARLEVGEELPERSRLALLRLAFRLAERLDEGPATHCDIEQIAPRLFEAVTEGGV